MTPKTPAAIEHHNLIRALLRERALGTLTEDAEEAMLCKLDALWIQLTDEEQEAENQFARDINAKLDAAPIAEVAVEPGDQRLPHTLPLVAA